MRILHVLEATQGGTRRHVLDLIPALIERGVACDLIYSTRRHPHFEHDAAWLQQRGARIWNLPMARGYNPAIDAPAVRQLRAHLRRHRPDILHLHSTKAGLLGRLAQSTLPPWARPALVYTPHCIAFDTLLPRGQRRAARWIERALAPLTDAFIAVSQHESRALSAAGIGSRSGFGRATSRRHVVYNGIDLDAFDKIARSAPSKYFEDEGALTIGCFGRLTRQKNQGVLLRALTTLPEAQLLLIGGGEDERELRALAADLGVSKRVRWTGELEEPRGLYARCAIVAQPSHWEGCPYSILEAMAARRAVAATAVGGVREVLGTRGHCGILARPAEFAPRLSELARDEARCSILGQNARERIEKYFTLDTMVAATLRVYQSAVENH